MIWIKFFVCITLLIIVSLKLSSTANVIADTSGLGSFSVGATLLAGVTSLPEFISGVYAIHYIDKPDLAVASISGSCLFNLMILGMLGLFQKSDNFLDSVSVSRCLVAALSCFILGITVMGVFLSNRGMDVLFGFTNIFSIVLIIFYFFSINVISRFEKKQINKAANVKTKAYKKQVSKKYKAYTEFGLLIVAIAILGIWMAVLGEEIAEISGWETFFVGWLFLAGFTSFPELATGILAARSGDIDLAVYNIFGSNLFNIAIIGVYDIIFFKGDLWVRMDFIHIFAGIISMAMTSLGIVVLINRKSTTIKKIYRFDIWMFIALYLSGMYIIYLG